MRIKVTERAWKYDPNVIRVKKGQIVEITFVPTDNGLGVGHRFAISSYDECVFLNGAMVGAPKVGLVPRRLCRKIHLLLRHAMFERKAASADERHAHI